MERRYISTRLHSAISQNAVIFKVINSHNLLVIHECETSWNQATTSYTKINFVIRVRLYGETRASRKIFKKCVAWIEQDRIQWGRKVNLGLQ